MTKTITWEATPLSVQNEALVASGGIPRRPHNQNIPVNPPKDWFAKRDFRMATPIQLSSDGQLYGHAAKWGTTHISFIDKWVKVPKSKTNYSKFMNKRTLTAEGDLLWTGVVVMDTVHPKTKGISAGQASSFYDKTGCAIADVKVYEDAFGIQVCGAVRPTVSTLQMREIRGTDYSPDWRWIDGNLEMVGLLAVNLSGFIVDGLEGLVASGGSVGINKDDYALPGTITATWSKDGEMLELFGATFESFSSEREPDSLDEIITDNQDTQEEDKMETEVQETETEVEAEIEVEIEIDPADLGDSETPVVTVTAVEPEAGAVDGEVEIEVEVTLEVDPEDNSESTEDAQVQEPTELATLAAEMREIKEQIAALLHGMNTADEIKSISLDD